MTPFSLISRSNDRLSAAIIQLYFDIVNWTYTHKTDTMFVHINNKGENNKMAAPRKENVKDIIMNATEELLQENSLADISLASIAKAAGISKGTLYYHYKVKEDILLDITDRYLDEQWNDLIKWTEDKGKDTSLHRLIKYVIERSINISGPRIHLLYNACIGNEEISGMLLERYKKFQRIISKKIAERIGDENADYIAWACLLISDGLIVQEGLKNKELDIDEFIRKTDSFVKGMQKTEAK